MCAFPFAPFAFWTFKRFFEAKIVNDRNIDALKITNLGITGATHDDQTKAGQSCTRLTASSAQQGDAAEAFGPADP